MPLPAPLPSPHNKKRSIASFFTPAAPAAKRVRTSPPSSHEAEDTSTTSSHISTASTPPSHDNDTSSPPPPSTHHTYPHPIDALPTPLAHALSLPPPQPPRTTPPRPDLDILHYAPYVPFSTQTTLYRFLRSHLPFYRVRYTIRRGPTETVINTPRYTTVFGVDATSVFEDAGARGLLDATTRAPVPKGTYKCAPRPLPGCLDVLRRGVEAALGETFNFCLVNYYAGGADSISYHSDDEAFLGARPCIASFSLGGRRDFLLRHKDGSLEKELRDLKMSLGGGDCVVMRGRTQERWMHSIPKRSEKAVGGGELGRINITFRKALVKAGTENYYRYNVGGGEVWRWNEGSREMKIWEGGKTC